MKRKDLQLSAETFTLVDRDGHPRAVLLTDPGTHLPVLTMFDNEGRGRLVLGIGKDGGPQITLQRSDGTTAISIAGGDEPEEGWGLRISHPSGALAFRVLVSLSGRLEIEVCDASGACIWKPDQV